MQCYNALFWNLSNLPKPKIVIVQWPYKDRRSFGSREHDGISIADRSYTKTLDGKWWKKRYIQDTGEQELSILLWYESFNNIWKQMNVPVLNFTWDSNLLSCVQRSKYKIYFIKPNSHDKARDCQHDGVLYHRDTAEQLKKIIELLNLTHKV